MRREIRTMTFGATNTLQSVVPPFHTWLRLVRSGNNFTAYSSTNGTTWVQFGQTVTISMNSCIQVGLFVESLNNTTTTQATFDNVFTSGGNQMLSQAPHTQGIPVIEMTREVSIFPNPATGVVNIDLTAYAGRPVRLEVCNLFGQVMHYVDIDEVQHDLVNMDLSGYAKGAYLIRVISGGAPTVTKLFNIQ
ncbi:MAG: T9SS type A sorting domain-containing protein [Saprospiraceae bacterium]|nr:T9SS type A sorting domain-containing protein [Saprospiraceae bacterium]